MKRRSLTKAQWLEVRGVAGNGWGDGDYLELLATPAEKRKCRRAMIAFEQWIESRFSVEFKNHLFGRYK